MSTLTKNISDYIKFLRCIDLIMETIKTVHKVKVQKGNENSNSFLDEILILNNLPNSNMISAYNQNIKVSGSLSHIFDDDVIQITK